MPSFFFFSPAKNPRTVCCAQPVVSAIWATVAPSGRRSSTSTCSCLVPWRGPVTRGAMLRIGIAVRRVGRRGRWRASRLVEVPDVALVAGAAPIVLAALAPAVQHRLELLVVVGAAQGEGVT